jgi:hypothetical protein
METKRPQSLIHNHGFYPADRAYTNESKVPSQIFAVILDSDCEVPENDNNVDDDELGSDQSL